MNFVPKVSVITPVYNVCKYIRRSLDSILSQTLHEFELILVDDGSSDGSSEICDEYSQRDSRVRVIHKSNGGVSSARQAGMDIAKGEYIIHVDPDDWVDLTMLAELYEKAKQENVDVVLCDYFVNTTKEQKTIHQSPSCNNAPTILHELFTGLHGSCCNKLVKKSTLIFYNVKFPEEINYCEDLLIWVQLFRHPNVTISYLSKAFYHYNCLVENSSITSNYSKKLLDTRMKVLDKIIEWYPISEDKEDIIIMQKLSIKSGAFSHPILSAKEYRDIYPEVTNLILSKRGGSIIDTCLIRLACVKGFYSIATSLYYCKNFLTKKSSRA